mgnify:FL=1
MKKELTTIEKLRKVFFSEVVEDVAFAEFKTSEGLTLKVSEIKEGEAVTVVTGEGEEVSEALSGEAEYVLEDGTKVSVDAEGLITKVEAGEEEKPEEALEMSAILEAVKEAGAEDNKVLMQAIDDIAKIILDQEERIETFAKAPAAPKKVEGKKSNSKKKELRPLEGLQAFRAAQKS